MDEIARLADSLLGSQPYSPNNHKARETLLAQKVRIETLERAMAKVAEASEHLQKNGMKPGWGVAKDLLNEAQEIAKRV